MAHHSYWLLFTNVEFFARNMRQFNQCRVPSQFARTQQSFRILSPFQDWRTIYKGFIAGAAQSIVLRHIFGVVRSGVQPWEQSPTVTQMAPVPPVQSQTSPINKDHQPRVAPSPNQAVRLFHQTTDLNSRTNAGCSNTGLSRCLSARAT